jgi:hypothetical protein
MGLLSKSGQQAAATTGGLYINPSKIPTDSPLRFSLPAVDQILEAYEAWGENEKGDKVPFRFIAEPTDAEMEAEMGAAGCTRRLGFDNKNYDAAKFILAFPVYSHNADGIRVLALSQKGIIQELDRLSQIPEYEDLTEHDFQLARKGSGKETEYHLTALPRKAGSTKAINAAWEAVEPKFDIKRLLTNGDPFSQKDD